MKSEIGSAGGWLVDDVLIAAQLGAGNAVGALTACDGCLPQLNNEGRVRSRWLVREMRIHALLELGRFDEARHETDAVLSVIVPLGWRMLEWRMRASRAAALAGLGDATASDERKAAQKLLMQIAGTLDKSAMRAKFLAQPAAAALLA